MENDICINGKPSVLNIEQETKCNQNYRKEIWTGQYLQVTVMNIPVGSEIGLEMHDNLDQFIKVESGCAKVYMGESKHCVKLVGTVNANNAIIIPAGTWHTLINACACPLKVYSIYAPRNHSVGTVHQTKLDADLSEH